MTKHIPLDQLEDIQGTTAWRSPSNIAIVKYWGKHGVQLPRNASLSFTLSAAYTDTKVSYRGKYDSSEGISLSFLFEGAENQAFADKIKKYMASLQEDMPWLGQLEFSVESSNSFPHSSGIASSASAMSALALCLCSIEQELFDGLQEDGAFERKASYLARLGSGSAARSVIPEIGAWGVCDAIEESSDIYAVDVDGVHPSFLTYHDDILIINAGEKSVSSRAGHALMEGNPYATARYQQANDRVAELIDIMRKGDHDAFGKLAEDEAMTLHALMMCSDPSYVLMKPNTLQAIEDIRAYRAETGVPIYFTLDAGPNIHILYPHHVATEAQKFIKDALKKYCQDGRIIEDQVGRGPIKLA